MRTWPTLRRLSAAVVTLLVLGATHGLAQDRDALVEEAQMLQQEIDLLQQLNRMGLTAVQRESMAQIIEEYQAARFAALAPQDPEGLVDAFAVIRDTLLAGEEPTPEMWQAVQAATGQTRETQQAHRDARQKALSSLADLLTEEQKPILVLPPATELAESVLGQVARLRQVPEAERPQALQDIVEQVGNRLQRGGAGEIVQQVQTMVQGVFDRLRGVNPQDLVQQREQIVSDLVNELQPLMELTEEQLTQRLSGRLNQWIESPVALGALHDSAAVMK